MRPSICSKRFSLIAVHMGSRIKSIPSLRASFAAGTKSLSPAIRIIWSVCFLYAGEAISNPILIFVVRQKIFLSTKMFLSGENQYRVAIKDGILFCSKSNEIYDRGEAFRYGRQLQKSIYNQLMEVMGALMRWKRSCVLKKQSTKKMLTVSTPGSVN